MIHHSVVGVARPNFLILTPLSVSLGVASVLLSGHPLEGELLTAVILGAVMAHISVNSLNEYADYQSGLDFKTHRTPFSGGSGTLVNNPDLAPYARYIGVLSLALAIACGIYLVLNTGWGLFPIGLLGVLIILFYTGWINKHRLLVLIAPGLGFGPLMVVGTHYALTGVYDTTAFLLSLIPFCLVNNLLLMNQIPDIEADRSVGRDNYVIAWHPQRSAWIYAGFNLLAYAILVMGAITGLLPKAALVGLAPAIFSYQVFNAIKRYHGDTAKLIPSMGKNVLITLATPALLFVGVVYHVQA
ncbi:MAG: prenyltransferase [Candidatus Thiodiazotropha sp. (ex Monitilora ramsayi)]|nr:prenyltransferase [Candidatus Thiodiazotropha sp. (ex Monitilora ramsayi)]